MQQDELERLLRAFERSRILLSAIELNVFSAIGQGATAAGVATRTASAGRATEVLLNALASMGLIEKLDGVFRNTPIASRLLAEQSPECTRTAFLHHVERWRTWSNLTGCIRGEIEPEIHRALPIERHRALLAMLNRKAADRAPKFLRLIGTEGVRRVLDLGGGSAAYSIAFVRSGEGLEADVFDLPEVLPITREYVTAAGEQDRVHLRPGDLLKDDLGSGYDLILLFSLCHIFGEAENRELLARCFQALNPGGRLAIHDHILSADKTSPSAGAIFAINMLVATPTGGTYSFGEYDAWLRKAGFSEVELCPLEAEPTGLLLATR